MATLFPTHTHPQAPGPSGISAGCLGLTGVEPPQLAEAGKPESEQRLLLCAQCVRQHAEGFTLQHCGRAGGNGGGIRPRATPQLPTSLARPLQLFPATQKSLAVPVTCSQFPLAFCTVQPYRSGRQPGWRVPGR